VPGAVLPLVLLVLSCGGCCPVPGAVLRLVLLDSPTTPVPSSTPNAQRMRGGYALKIFSQDIYTLFSCPPPRLFTNSPLAK